MINRKIEYFITLAECLSFTQTAGKYNVTQTAISQYIASLEDRLGVKLFDRSQHNVSLTEPGRFYYRRVRQLWDSYAETLDELRTMASGYTGRLKVGVGMYEYCSTERFFSDFLTAHPEIRVDILQYPYSVLSEKLKSGELDVIIADELCLEAFSKRELNTRIMIESPNYIVASAAVAGDSPVDELLRRECLVTNCEPSGPSSMSMLRTLLMDAFGFVPENIAQTNSVNAQLMLVRAGHGIAIVPGFVIDMMCPDLKRMKLPEEKPVRYRLIYLRGCPNPAAKLLFDFETDM